MDFEWDENKEAINIQKHGLDFETASLVFYDDQRIEKYDSKHSLFEDRYITIGMIFDAVMVVTVVYTARTDSIRIISARVANSKEKEAYYGKEEN